MADYAKSVAEAAAIVDGQQTNAEECEENLVQLESRPPSTMLL